MNRVLVTALVLVVVASWVATAAFAGEDISAKKFPSVSTAVTAVSIAIFIFDRWAWQPVGHLLGRPVIAGTWRGTLKSYWVNPETHQRVPEIQVVGVVTQTFSSVVFRLMTKESQSVTSSAALALDEDGRASLVGVYQNVPRPEVRGRSEVHAGALRLLVEGEPPKGLTGSYWTERKTLGEIALVRVSDKRAHTFDEGIAMQAKT
jgi:hypothetical protein